ncbi:MAG: sulfatase-like hydrolase/transferase [Alteromonadaceae bacterium]|nr:sulfatase-like hydrolase/transferase [Alteromonadaceae bacterium]
MQQVVLTVKKFTNRTTLSKVSISKDKIQPNILLIVTDDAGYSDFGFSGTKNFATPHINKLANTGVVFD